MVRTLDSILNSFNPDEFGYTEPLNMYAIPTLDEHQVVHCSFADRGIVFHYCVNIYTQDLFVLYKLYNNVYGQTTGELMFVGNIKDIFPEWVAPHRNDWDGSTIETLTELILNYII